MEAQRRSRNQILGSSNKLTIGPVFVDEKKQAMTTIVMKTTMRKTLWKTRLMDILMRCNVRYCIDLSSTVVMLEVYSNNFRKQKNMCTLHIPYIIYIY